MSGRNFKDMEKLRELVRAALAAGNNTTADVTAYIERHKPEDFDSPSDRTVRRLISGEGYELTEAIWVRKAVRRG